MSLLRKCLRFIDGFVIIRPALIYLLTCRARYKILLKDQSLLWQFRALCSENCKPFGDDEAGFFICFFELGPWPRKQLRPVAGFDRKIAGATHKYRLKHRLSDLSESHFDSDFWRALT
jgi:hypothetical protein